MNRHLVSVIPTVPEWDLKLAVTTGNGNCNFKISKDGEIFIVKGSIGDEPGVGENSFTLDLTNGDESIAIQLKRRQLEDFIQECDNEKIFKVLQLELPIKKIEGENRTETALKVRNWIFGLEDGVDEDSLTEAEDYWIRDSVKVEMSMRKDIVNFKQEIYTDEGGSLVLKRSVNDANSDRDFWILYNLTEGKVTTNMEENHMNLVMDSWNTFEITIILEILAKVEIVKSHLLG